MFTVDVKQQYNINCTPERRDNSCALARGLSTVLVHKPCTCTMVSSVDLAHYGVFHAKDWVSVDGGTSNFDVWK